MVHKPAVRSNPVAVVCFSLYTPRENPFPCLTGSRISLYPSDKPGFCHLLARLIQKGIIPVTYRHPAGMGPFDEPAPGKFFFCEKKYN